MESLDIRFYVIHILQTREVTERDMFSMFQSKYMVSRIDPCLLMAQMIEKNTELPRASSEFPRVTTKESQLTLIKIYP